MGWAVEGTCGVGDCALAPRGADSDAVSAAGAFVVFVGDRDDVEDLRSSFVDLSDIGPLFRYVVTGRGSVSLASFTAERNPAS